MRWMLMCLALGSFMLLYNEVDHSHPSGQYTLLKVRGLNMCGGLTLDYYTVITSC